MKLGSVENPEGKRQSETMLLDMNWVEGDEGGERRCHFIAFPLQLYVSID